jgi:hypothetical protein
MLTLNLDIPPDGIDSKEKDVFIWAGWLVSGVCAELGIAGGITVKKSTQKKAAAIDRNERTEPWNKFFNKIPSNQNFLRQ